LEKIKANALQSCERLGKYRMPFCWTAVYLMNVINGKSSLERDSADKDSSGSNSLGRYFLFVLVNYSFTLLFSVIDD